MDILIKGMEMPSERTMFEVFPDGKVFEIHPTNNARIPTGAKAIPVPIFLDYKTKADVLLKLWMDEIITDGEYYKIMERLNKAVLRGRTNG